MPDVEIDPTDDASIRVDRLDNGSIKVTICDEPGGRPAAHVVLNRKRAGDIARIILEKLREALG